MGNEVQVIPALSMKNIEHKRVAVYACEDLDDKQNLSLRSHELNETIIAVYKNPRWKMARLYMDHELKLPLADRHAYKDFAKDASENKIDILCMWSLRQMTQDEAEFEKLLAFLRKKGIILKTLLEEIDTSVNRDAMVYALWRMGIG